MEVTELLDHTSVVVLVVVRVHRGLVLHLPRRADSEQIRVEREEAAVGGFDGGPAAVGAELLSQEPLVFRASCGRERPTSQAAVPVENELRGTEVLEMAVD